MRKWLLILALAVAACTPTVPQPLTPTAAPPTSAPPAAAQPTTAPTSVSTAATVEPSDLTPYRAAMRSDFVKDLDQFAAATQYQIDLTIAPDLSSYTAIQHVHYTNVETTPLSAVYFRLFPNTPSYGGQLTMNGLKLNGVEVQPVSELGNSALRIPIDPPLPIGAAVDFELDYAAQVPVITVTLGYNQFGFFNGVLALPNFYPQIPVYDAEGWNVEFAPGIGDAVFSDSALYQVNILAPKDQIIATSGVCESQAAPEGQQYQRCVSGPMRDFMIAMSADFQVASETVDDIKINSYYLPKDAAAGRNGSEYHGGCGDVVRETDRPLSFQ